MTSELQDCLHALEQAKTAERNTRAMLRLSNNVRTAILRSPRPRAGSGHSWHVRGNRRARSHTVWCPRSSSAGCTLPASPGRRGPAAPCGDTLRGGLASEICPRHTRPVGPLIAPADALPRSQGPVGCVGRVRSDLGGAPRPGRSPAAPTANLGRSATQIWGPFPIQKGRFTWRTPVGPVSSLFLFSLSREVNVL